MHRPVIDQTIMMDRDQRGHDGHEENRTKHELAKGHAVERQRQCQSENHRTGHRDCTKGESNQHTLPRRTTGEKINPVLEPDEAWGTYEIPLVEGQNKRRDCRDQGENDEGYQRGRKEEPGSQLLPREPPAAFSANLTRRL
jgi:hypothetical protein